MCRVGLKPYYTIPDGYLNEDQRGRRETVVHLRRVFNDALYRSTFTLHRVTTCLENLEMSGNLTAVREMSGILLKIREMSGKKSCQGKVA